MSNFVAVLDEVNGGGRLVAFIALLSAYRFPFDLTIQLREYLDGDLVRNHNRNVLQLQ